MKPVAVNQGSSFTPVPGLQVVPRRLSVPEFRSLESSTLWSSLVANLRDLIFPEKLPPLTLTSRPVAVRSLWEPLNVKRAGGYSLLVHAGMAVAVVALAMIGGRSVKETRDTTTVTLIPTNLSIYMPDLKGPTMGGGGGGGDQDKLLAPKGKLPKVDMNQLSPPVIVVRNDDPKLPVEPSIMVPPNVPLPNNSLPTIGDPLLSVVGPPSNGTGAGGGIGSGRGGGIGMGTGRGLGPGEGMGYGGGVFRIGGGVQPPKPIRTPDPEYSEEARKAKYQGVCVLWLVVGPDGRTHDIRVQRALGMGLDQQAVEAVRQWIFEPATKDGKPVAVQINVEVNFRLY